MIYVRIIDSNGFFVEDAFVDELTEFTIETPCPAGFYLPKWNGTQWIEGKTTDEIAAMKNVPVEKTPEQRLSDLETLTLQNMGVI